MAFKKLTPLEKAEVSIKKLTKNNIILKQKLLDMNDLYKSLKTDYDKLETSLIERQQEVNRLAELNAKAQADLRMQYIKISDKTKTINVLNDEHRILFKIAERLVS